VLLIIYYSGHQINRNEMGRARSTYWVRTGEYGDLVGKRDRKRPILYSKVRASCDMWQ